MTIHNYEQLMAWKPADAAALVGKRIRLEEAADQRTYWADPHSYAGSWDVIGAGVVDHVETRMHHGRLEEVGAWFAGGGGIGWLSGQPVRLV